MMMQPELTLRFQRKILLRASVGSSETQFMIRVFVFIFILLLLRVLCVRITRLQLAL